MILFRDFAAMLRDEPNCFTFTIENTTMLCKGHPKWDPKTLGKNGNLDSPPIRRRETKRKCHFIRSTYHRLFELVQKLISAAIESFHWSEVNFEIQLANQNAHLNSEIITSILESRNSAAIKHVIKILEKSEKWHDMEPGTSYEFSEAIQILELLPLTSEAVHETVPHTK